MKSSDLAAVALAFATTGCAFMFKDSKQEVRFVSVPERADVRVDNRYLGVTPTTGKLDRYQSQSVRVSRDGFGDERVQLRRHPDTGWWIWDITTCVIPVTLCLPLLVDAISGTWFSLDDEVVVKLDQIPSRVGEATPSPPPARPPPLSSPSAGTTINPAQQTMD